MCIMVLKVAVNGQYNTIKLVMPIFIRHLVPAADQFTQIAFTVNTLHNYAYQPMVIMHSYNILFSHKEINTAPEVSCLEKSDNADNCIIVDGLHYTLLTLNTKRTIGY